MVGFGVCGPGDVDELVQLLAEVFTERDPPAVAVGLTVKEFQDLVELYRERVGTDGLTIIARSESTGEMVGALLAEDSAAPFPAGVERLSRKFDPIFDILTSLEAEYRRGRIVVPGDALHLFLLGVRRAFCGQRVAQGLVRASLENGVKRGYRRAVTEATNTISRHLFRKLGFVDCVSRFYADHRFQGRVFFDSIAAHGGPVLLERTLDRTPRL
jgi:ribosomal protein S18 acetylase RimI-like enzyme